MFDTYENPDRVINIPINAVKPNPYKPRKFFDITSVSELADSIKEIGLLQPISVRKLKAGTYELISGERRLRAAEIAGMESISAIVMNVSDNQSAVLTLAENIQRKNINFFEEATAFYHLVFDHKISSIQLAKKIGVRESAVLKMLKLSRLSPTVKNIIIENGLTEEHAAALLKLSDEQMRIDVLKKAIELDMSSEDFEKYIDGVLNSEINSQRKRRLQAKKIHCAGIKDYKIVFNTLSKALKLVEDTGIKTRAKRIEHDKYYEYVIRISK